MDTVSRQVRSSVMSKVKSKRNRSTEWRLEVYSFKAVYVGGRSTPMACQERLILCFVPNGW